MKKKIQIPILFGLGMILVASCSGLPGEKATNTRWLAQTREPSCTPSITRTPTLTLTPTITQTPTITSTPTPPPDLELKDVKIYPETFNDTGQTYSLIGRVRNNTNMIMVFHEEDLIFKFVFDVWEFDSFVYQRYVHSKYSEETVLSTGIYRKMNCILYPGDEGVFIYVTRAVSTDYILFEERDAYDGPLGFWYTYEGFYHTQPDLPLYYHPVAENLTFEKNDVGLAVDFDVSIHKLIREGVYGSSVYSWIILYDGDGKIINILKWRLNNMKGFDYGGTFHFHYNISASDNLQEYRNPPVKLTWEMIERTDRIEVFTEFEEGFTCYGKSK